MMPPRPLLDYAHERMRAFEREAYIWHLIREGRPSLRKRLALVLKALAERLEPELRHAYGSDRLFRSTDGSRLKRNTPLLP